MHLDGTDVQIEIRHMRYAVEAQAYGSFRKAALALGVKQSTLSRTIAQLEDRLGSALFVRTSGGVRLTLCGPQIIRTFRHLVESIDHIAANAKKFGLGRAGQLILGHYTSLSSGNLRASLAEFAERYSELGMLPTKSDLVFNRTLIL